MKLVVCVLVTLFALINAKAIPAPLVFGDMKVKEAWDSNNNPSSLGLNNYVKNFEQLPKSGELPNKPWSDTYWPSMKGGIAARWMTGENGFDYTLYTKDQIASLDQDSLKNLSPAEKFDIFCGAYDFPTVKEERSRTSPTCPSWEGICHGWSPASLNFKEPSPITIKNADGIEIPFGASDIKGLLSFWQGQVARGQTYFVASRCNWDIHESPEHSDDPECRDMNAGAFHISITNKIGKLQQGFVADVTRDLQVWNQPVYAYSTSVVSEQAPSEGAAAGTVKEIRVATDMTYAVELQQQWDPTGVQPRTVTYQYRVELDASGNIIGGDWEKEQWDRPDFLWTQSRPNFSGSWTKLGDLYNAATGNAAVRLVDPHESTLSPTMLVVLSVGITLGCVLVVAGVVYMMTKKTKVTVSSELTQQLV
jgi:hypothetical protein